MASKRLGVWNVRAPHLKDPEKENKLTHVQLHPEVVMDLKLRDGHICRIWNVDKPEVKYEGIAWTCTQSPMINYNVAVFYDSFRKRCGFDLADKICISAAGGAPEVAESVCLREISHEPLNISEEDKPYWEWPLRKSLGLAGHVFTGMQLKENPHRQKGIFEVVSINGQTNFLARFDLKYIKTVRILTDSTDSTLPATDRPRLEVSGIAGIDAALEKLNKHLQQFENRISGKRPKDSKTGRGILISGPSGTGKTMIIQKIQELGWGKTFQINETMKISQIRDIFKEAKLQPSIIFIDDLESLVTKEDSRSITYGIEKTIASELDNIGAHDILCIAATSKSNEIPKRLTELGRFNKLINIPVPTATSRKQIMRSLKSESILSSEIIERLGDRTHAYVGRDLAHLIEEAVDFTWDRIEELGLEQNEENYRILQEDIDKALHVVRPSAMRDVFLETTKVKWDEIGGQEEVKKTLRQVVERQQSNPSIQSSLFRLGITPTKGLLLYGPPGCSKTLSAQAVATEASLNFFAVKGAELLNMYVGESERQIRSIFAKARAASPSIIFFDEIEAIGSKRDGNKGNGGVNTLTTLLNEMDGIEALKDVTVIAATNKPEALDLALLRPGRFDKLLYVAPPDLAGRTSILRIQQNKRQFAESVNIEELAKMTDGYSGAELVAICNKAAEMVHEEFIESNVARGIEKGDFEKVVAKTKKQISVDLVKKYREWAGGRGVEVEDDD